MPMGTWDNIDGLMVNPITTKYSPPPEFLDPSLSIVKRLCSGLIPNMLQMIFGYSNYDNRKCPTSLKVTSGKVEDKNERRFKS